jgi:hypothetical protein
MNIVGLHWLNITVTDTARQVNWQLSATNKLEIVHKFYEVKGTVSRVGYFLKV